MKDIEQRKAAREFAEYWKNKGDEKGESQKFWLSLLRSVFGVSEPEKYITFEDRVFLGHTSFIDAYIPETKVLIEQKACGKDLRKSIKQSDGTLLTPFQQAKRYITELPVSKHPRWVVTCNFEKFLVYDMEKPGGDPEEIFLKDLEKEYYRLEFLINKEDENLKREMEVSIAAGEIVGLLYDAFLKEYKNPESKETLHSLNVLCVRLVFCLYAEDAGIFGHKGMFHDYLRRFETRDMRRALIDLFEVLNTESAERDPYLDPELAAFPYVNGGLFADNRVEIPFFTDEIRTLILSRASENFNWSEISPTIFGAVFESTLNPETRRSGGMHYTSIENIHRVIDPLFMDALQKEFESIREIKVLKTQKERLESFQRKIASLKWLDPACGSGNFLTETYISVRKLENQVISALISLEKGQTAGQMILGQVINPIMVSIGQFYGIEINDFAVTVAKTALWIAESQMMKQTEDIIHMQLEFLPLKSYVNIIEGNALRMDWNLIVPSQNMHYIMGNPPFVSQGGSSDRGQRQEGAGRNKEQAEDMKIVFGNEKGTGNLDYVSCWFRKAFDYMRDNHNIESAFVSTNSICQGQQVAPLWKKMFDEGITINFAHDSFLWKNEASEKALVYVIIVGFSFKNRIEKILYQYGNYKELSSIRKVNHINAYLLADAPDVFIDTRTKPICNVSQMVRGGGASDWGYLMLSEEEKDDLLAKEPKASPWIRPFLQGNEFIKGISRYCLWMEDIKPEKISCMPLVMQRIEAVREQRLLSKKVSTRKKADTPWLFDEIVKIDSDYYIAVPQVSAGSRRYIPIGYVSAEYIAGNKLLMVPGGTLYEFGVMCSNVHNAWIRVVASHYGPSYQYSANIAYNNFPWPTPTEAQKQRVVQTAQAILDARALYPERNLADLYGEKMYLYPELLKAHQQNDKAVMAAYGWKPGHEVYQSESRCVAELMKMYQKLC